MKQMILALILLLWLPSSAVADTVRGHWKDTNRDGIKDTYIQPYERSHPNSSRTDNYGYPGNYNPNSGQLTPRSNSPRETYPTNPNPYEKQKPKGAFGY